MFVCLYCGSACLFVCIVVQLPSQQFLSHFSSRAIASGILTSAIASFAIGNIKVEVGFIPKTSQAGF